MHIQRYIANPLLINGKKFDLRIYVVVTSFDPLRIYMHRDGLARFATHKYRNDRQNLRNRFMHLTNYSVNKKSKYFERNESAELDEAGSKWSIQALRKYLRGNGIDDNALWERIADLVTKTIISVDGTMNTLMKTLVSSKGGSCFELFGFDVMIDENLKPWLIEVNTSPSLSSSSPIDKVIKNNVITDLFNMVGFVSYDRKEHMNLLAENRRLRLLGLSSRRSSLKTRRSLPALNSLEEFHNLTLEDMQVIHETEDEHNRRGNFDIIFPTLENVDKFSVLFECQRYRNIVLSLWLKEKARRQQQCMARNRQRLCDSTNSEPPSPIQKNLGQWANDSQRSHESYSITELGLQFDQELSIRSPIRPSQPPNRAAPRATIRNRSSVMSEVMNSSPTYCAQQASLYIQPDRPSTASTSFITRNTSPIQSRVHRSRSSTGKRNSTIPRRLIQLRNVENQEYFITSTSGELWRHLKKAKRYQK